MELAVLLFSCFCVSIGQLEEEKEELQRLLANEKSARQLQEKINEEQQRFQQHLHEESQKTSSEKVIMCFFCKKLKLINAEAQGVPQ